MSEKNLQQTTPLKNDGRQKIDEDQPQQNNQNGREEQSNLGGNEQFSNKQYVKQKSIIKTPDDKASKKPLRKVTFVPPSEDEMKNDNKLSPSRTMSKNRITSFANLDQTTITKKFKKAQKSSQSLREVLNMFYEINKQDLIDEYATGIKYNFFYARANSSEILSQIGDPKPPTNSSSN